jgi:hypothetical protein
MIRAGATLLLCCFAFFLAVAPWENCETGSEVCAPVCHIFCQDGCTQAPLAAAVPAIGPAPPAAASFVHPDLSPGYAAYPPELPPPRV